MLKTVDMKKKVGKNWSKSHWEMGKKLGCHEIKSCAMIKPIPSQYKSRPTLSIWMQSDYCALRWKKLFVKIQFFLISQTIFFPDIFFRFSAQ